MLTDKIKSNKTLFTRMCIGEAVIALLAYHELKKLKVYDVAGKAGVSRMTFYKYYGTPQSALEDYIEIIINKFIEEEKNAPDSGTISIERIVYVLNYFDQYRDFFITMKAQGLYSLLIDNVNAFFAAKLDPKDKHALYKTGAYAGGLLNCFLMWELNGRQEPVEEVAKAIFDLYGGQKII